ncbi:MAG TPA: hypothetical protein VFG39_07210 [Balneolaceae bacterium]|nr:hypothetical protein [Balneolaceae bacterium]
MQLFYFLKRSILPFIIILLSFGTASAQTIKTEVSAGFNRPAFNIIDDESGILQPGTDLTSTYGLSVLVMENNWVFKTGIYSMDFAHAFYFKLDNGLSSEEQIISNISTYRIPISFGREIMLTGGFSITPKAGFSWLTSQATDTTGISSDVVTNFSGAGNANRVEYEAISRAVNKNKFLAEVGLDLNFQLNWIFVLKVGARYSFGLQPIEKTEITYQINNGETYTGTLVSDGSGWNFNVGLVIPIYN